MGDASAGCPKIGVPLWVIFGAGERQDSQIIMKKLFIIGILISIILFVSRVSYIGYGVWGDGLGYYVYTRSLYFDHDIDFHNEYDHYQDSRWFWLPTETKTHFIHNHWSIGPGILWLPYMGLGHVIGQFLTLGGISYPLDGYSAPYEIIVGFGNILYGYLGLYVLYKWLLHYFSKKISVITSLSIYLATNLIYYISFEPNLSHGVSFFITAFFLYIFQKVTAVKSHQGYALLGLVGGLAAIIRHYDVVLIIVPIAQLVFSVIARGKQPRGNASLKLAMTLIVFFVIGIFPQLLSQKIIYGHFWYQPYILEGNAQALSMHNNFVWQTLFSLHRGLFFWSPILLLSIVGWIYGYKKYWKMFLIFLLIFITQWQVIGHWSAALSAGFGARMYISSFPLFAFGLALFYQKIKNIKFIAIIIIIFTIWNLLLLNQFFIDKRLLEGQLTLPEILQGQITSILKISDKLTNK